MLSGLVFGGYMWGFRRSFGLGVLAGCCFAVVMTPIYYVVNRRRGQFLPPGLDRGSRIAVRRIVRTGAAVDDPALAPAVAFHADAMLRVPYQPALSVGAVVTVLGAVGSLMAVLQDGDIRHVWNMGLVLIVAGTLIANLVFTARLRRRATVAYQRAQQMMAMQG